MTGNYSIVNMMSSAEAKILHESNQKGWLIYARRIQKNPYIRRMLYNKYKGVCQFCGKKLKDNWVLHHANYDKECSYPENIIKISSPTPKRPGRVIKTPNCEHCDKIMKCVEDLYPVCCVCNMIIDKVARRESD